MTLTEAHFNIAGGAWDDNAVRLVAKEAQKGTKFWKEDVLEFAFKHRSPESLPEGQGSLAKLLYSRWKANPGNYLDSLDLKTEQAGATLDAAASAFKTDGSKAASSALKADASNTAVETTKSSGSRITKLKDTFQGWKSKLSNLRTGLVQFVWVEARSRKLMARL